MPNIIAQVMFAILDKKNGECINFCLPDEAKEKLVRILSEYDVYQFLHADGNSYIDGYYATMEQWTTVPDEY